MQQRASLSLDLFPSDGLYFAGLNLVQAAHDLLRHAASTSRSMVASRLEIKFPANSARSFSGRASAFCSSSRASWVMSKLYAWLQLPVNITGGGRVAATTDNTQSICTSPDPVCTVTSGPPPRTLPRTALCSWRTSPCNVMVTGWSTTTLPEPVDAPRSNAACSGSLS